MNSENAVRRAIEQLSAELNADVESTRAWTSLSEDELFYELVVCICGSQVRYEMAVSMADALKNASLLSSSRIHDISADYELRILDVLSEPVLVSSEKQSKYCKPRFKNKFSRMISRAAASIYSGCGSLSTILCEAKTDREARRALIAKICGMGPKQASLYLRRISFSTELAVLDVHILDFLELILRIDVKNRNLSTLRNYELVESDFVRCANNVGVSPACFDLATWVTMRVAKREMLFCA